ncbi:hypothetical protein [Paenisporosarcina sp. NPDC076898]|uniref:hypothetical protein n=1 Tax=unclassified Paenisporosarcina TaxID=2642018 RepID=UPI003D094463
MAEKTFVNNSMATLIITIFIRQGADPVNQDGSESFTLNPQESLLVEYGDETNEFLNGFVLFTIFEGDLYSKVQFTTAVGTELDDLLNTNNIITFTKVGTDYVVSGSNA